MTLHPIAATVVAEIAASRAAPHVYLLDDRGALLAAPAGTAEVPEIVRLLLGMFTAPAAPAAPRAPLAAILDVDGLPTAVRIVASAIPGPPRFAVTVAAFAVRDRPASPSAELSPAP